jgi:Zn/Cd-binding protein ZinT
VAGSVSWPKYIELSKSQLEETITNKSQADRRTTQLERINYYKKAFHGALLSIKASRGLLS